MRALDLFRLDGRVAIVTGGGTGLGKQMATGLAEAGAAVVLAGRRLGRCQAAAEEITRAGGTALAVRADVTDPAQVNALVEAALARFGRLDILVNNAGISYVRPIEETPLERWQEVIATNLTGIFLCCQAAWRPMHERGGSIINIASIYGALGVDTGLYTAPGQPPFAIIAYTSSKGGVVNLTRDLAANWARFGIRVNAISPGAWEHIQEGGGADRALLDRIAARTPLRRNGGPDDLKGAVVYLASDASAFVTGHNLVVDGGWSIW